MGNQTTIAAVSTPPGMGGIAVVRLSGPDAFAIADSAWRGRSLAQADTHTAHLGYITDAGGGDLDQAVATVFRAPRSFTGEDTVEFSVHGSPWIQRAVVKRLVELGAEPAGPGEFSQRAVMNGRLDLAQAEGVADLIAASSRAAQRLALSQLDGRFSNRLDTLRAQLVDLAALLELELDFSEEEVEFADRERLRNITDETIALIDRLAGSYSAGRAFREGVPVVIAGRPNAGKSTLLNALLDRDKAIVSDIPGTTRDVIEDTCEIDGILYRFFDTAGLRDTDDLVERMGIDRAEAQIDRAAIVLWVIDLTDSPASQVEYVRCRIAHHEDARHIILLNKTDRVDREEIASTVGQLCDAALQTGESELNCLSVSAEGGDGLENLKSELHKIATEAYNPDAELIVTNARHYAALRAGGESLRMAREALDAGLSADLVAQDVREAIHHLGSITATGAITTPELLSTIFSRFCIGK